MLINTEVVIGVLCPRCGKIRPNNAGAFRSFASGAHIGFCACGARTYSLFSQKDGFAFHYECIYCGRVHRLTLRRSEIFSGEIRDLSCLIHHLPAGCLGAEEEARARCLELKEEFVKFALNMTDERMTDKDFSSFFALYGFMEKMEAAVKEGRSHLPIKKALSPKMAVVRILRGIRHILAAER
jgi:hypothetical protein